MRMKVNDTCIGCGLCSVTCPDVFYMESGVAHAIDAEIDEANLDTAQDALENCPVSAIEEV